MTILIHAELSAIYGDLNRIEIIELLGTRESKRAARRQKRVCLAALASDRAARPPITETNDELLAALGL